MKIKLDELKSIIKFGSVGIINTLINWTIFFILNLIGVDYIFANICAYSIATINSYILNSKWVFNYINGSRIKALIKFVLLNLIGVILNTIILYILVDKFNINKMFSLIITTSIVMIINYMTNKFWVFKKNVIDYK